MNRLRTIGIPIALGLVGVFLGLAFWHGWQDHQALHQLVGWVNAELAKGTPK